jgi:hypothetical protein
MMKPLYSVTLIFIVYENVELLHFWLNNIILVSLVISYYSEFLFDMYRGL